VLNQPIFSLHGIKSASILITDILPMMNSTPIYRPYHAEHNPSARVNSGTDLTAQTIPYTIDKTDFQHRQTVAAGKCVGIFYELNKNHMLNCIFI